MEFTLNLQNIYNEGNYNFKLKENAKKKMEMWKKIES